MGIALGSGDKEALGFVNDVQPGEVQIPAVQQIEGARLDGELVQHVDLVGLAIGDVNKTENIAVQVQQRMHPNSGFGRAKRCPRVQRQAQIDGGGVEGENRCIQIDTQRLLGVQRPSHANQMLRKVGINLPRLCGVRMGKRVARNCLAAKSHVVQPFGLGAQVHFDVAQGLAVGQLRKRHGQELIQTREIFDLVFAAMRGYTAAKGAQWQEGHELGKHELALVHGSPWRDDAKDHEFGDRRSNIDQTQTLNLASKSLTYDVLI